jgi:hypothetical protein
MKPFAGRNQTAILASECSDLPAFEAGERAIVAENERQSAAPLTAGFTAKARHNIGT